MTAFIYDPERNMLININQIVTVTEVTGGAKGEDVQYTRIELSNSKKYKMPISIPNFRKLLIASEMSKFTNLDIEDEV